MCFFYKKLNILISGEQNFEILQYKPYIFQLLDSLLHANYRVLRIMFTLTLRFEVKRSQNPIKSPLCHPSLK